MKPSSKKQHTNSGIRAKGLESIRTSGSFGNDRKTSPVRRLSTVLSQLLLQADLPRVSSQNRFKHQAAKKILNRAKFHRNRSTTAPRKVFGNRGAPICVEDGMEPSSHGDLSHVRCYRCQSFGHYAYACPSKSSNSVFPVESKPKDIDYIVKGSDCGNWNETWYVNPSVKKHQTSNQTLFHDFKNIYKVERDNHGELMFVHGLGVVKLFVNGRNRKIPHVRFVPSSNKNVFSEEQLIMQGYDVKFDGDYCIITKAFEDNKVVNEIVKNKVSDKGKGIENSHSISSFQFHQHDANVMFDHLEGIKEEGKRFKANWDMCVMFLNMVQVHGMFNKHKNYLKNEFVDLVRWFVEVFQKSKGKDFPPKLEDGKIVDLLDLYMGVHMFGGFRKVTQGQKWTDLAVTLGFRIDQGSDIQTIYYKYLNTLEWYYQTITKRGYFEDKDLIELVDTIGETSEEEESIKPLPIKKRSTTIASNEDGYAIGSSSLGGSNESDSFEIIC